MSSLGDSIQKLRDKMGSLGRRGGGADTGASGGKSKLDAKAVIGWCKRNPAIVASVAVMIAAPTAAWWFSSEMHAAADTLTEEHVKELAALERLEKTAVEIALPGKEPLNQTGVVTPRMVAAYENLTGKLREDAIAVQRAALVHNQKNRTQLFANIEVKASNVNVIAGDTHRALMDTMRSMLATVRAGSPPDVERVLDQVQRRQDQFIAGEKKADRANLSADELAKLQSALTEKRLQVYADAAANLSFYADVTRLGLPAGYEDAGSPPMESRFFYWQWRAWVAEDILRALAKANEPYRSVIDAPVKRLVGMRFLDKEVVPEAPKAQPGGAAAESGSGGAAVQLIDPKAAVPYAFSRTFTGRQTNALYDVRECVVDLVVATHMLPEVLNAIARENFMTVTNMTLTPADPFKDAEAGFIYGPAHVSRVRLTIESVWLREWTGKLMPRSLQAALGTTGYTADNPPPPGGQAGAIIDTQAAPEG